MKSHAFCLDLWAGIDSTSTLLCSLQKLIASTKSSKDGAGKVCGSVFSVRCAVALWEDIRSSYVCRLPNPKTHKTDSGLFTSISIKGDIKYSHDCTLQSIIYELPELTVFERRPCV